MLLKCNFGNFLAIGGNPKEITPLQWACYNWEGINTAELLDLGNSEEFQYFLITEKDYLTCRAKAFANNWGYNGYKGRVGGVWKLAYIKAKKELDSFGEEDFLTRSVVSEYIYNFGELEPGQTFKL